MGFMTPKAPKPAPPLPTPTAPPTTQVAGLPEANAVARSKPAAQRRAKAFQLTRIPLMGGVRTQTGINTRV